MIEQIYKRADGSKYTCKEVISMIAEFIAKNPDYEYELTVGTDSQTFADHTKIVEVIALHRLGHGGIYFYHIDYVEKFRTLRDKIYEETARSLEVSKDMLLDVAVILDEKGINIDDINVHFQIHCDIGTSGKTKELIKEIVGWVTSEGYDCLIKPDSYTANAIADRYSK